MVGKIEDVVRLSYSLAVLAVAHSYALPAPAVADPQRPSGSPGIRDVPATGRQPRNNTRILSVKETLPVPIDDFPPVHLSRHAVGESGAVAETGAGTATVYKTQFAGYVFGPVGAEPCSGVGEQIILGNAKGDGTDELRSYTVEFGAFCEVEGECGPGGRCEGFCFPSQTPGISEYTISTMLWDGPPQPGASCQPTGNPIPGTACQFTTDVTGQRVAATCEMGKVAVPGEIWLTMASSIDDFWMVVGGSPQDGDAPGIGSSPSEAFFSVDTDGDSSCSEEWDCSFCFNSCFGCDAGAPLPECDWMHIPSVEANAQVAMFLVPVEPPAATKHAATFDYSVLGDEALLSRAGQPVWIEIRLTDFDPKGTGTELTAWEAHVDSEGYSGGLAGTLFPFLASCTSDADCEAQIGPMREAAACNHPQVPANTCFPGILDFSRTDYVFFDADAGGDPAPFFDPPTGEYLLGHFHLTRPVGPRGLQSYYLATIVLFVPPHARGTFTIGLKDVARATHLLDANDELVPLVSLQDAKITVQTGQCCFGLDGGSPGCVDEVTINECEDQPGVVDFTPDATCDDPCPTCGDNLVNTPLEECDGADDSACPGRCRSDCTCEPLPEPVPTVSAWGVSILTLLLLTGSRIYFGRRRCPGNPGTPSSDLSREVAP